MNRAAAVAAVILSCLVGAAPLRADQVTSKSTKVRGKVTRLDSIGVSLEPEYGAGVVVMKWKDVEEVTTDGALYFQYGEDEEVVAPVRGKHGGSIRAGDKEIDVTTIYAGTPVGPEGPTWKQRLRGRWRHWHGSVDLGFNYQQSTIDASGLTIGFDTTRAKAPTRLILGAGYRYFTTKKQEESRETVEDEIKGLLRGEYDLTERLYSFASDDVKYDKVNRLRIRSVPKAGVGYAIYREELGDKRQNLLSVEAGGAYVYQKFFGDEEDSYFAAGFGLVAAYTLPYGSMFDLRSDYLPAIDDWAERFLLRHTASLSAPIFDPISVKLSLVDEYNNKPAPGTSRNSLYLTAGLSVGW